ncbi:ABC transporter permease [Lentzea kentuckyensis]|uniref:ABC transporter permease n=1 Tax=Lentzea kentuckyensis TaxID=360086 RepID=UPI000A3C016C|nr:ABC transporter permease [Lentzea kentuckyensis]
MSRWTHLVERNALVYRRLWLVMVAGLLEPCVYLLGLGYGIGTLIGPSYAAFVAPALIATAAMNGAIYDTTFSVLHKLRYERIYDTLLTTPLTTRSIAAGEVAWALLRGAVYISAMIAFTALLDLLPLSAAVLPAALLVTFCFAALGCAITTYLRSWQDVENVNLAQLVIFLCSGTLFPVDVYPAALRWLVELSPLTRGIDLLRGLAGPFQPVLLLDVAYLLGLGLAGLAITTRRLARVVLR